MISFKVAAAVKALVLAAGCGISATSAYAHQDGAKPGSARDSVETEIKQLEQMEAKAFLERDKATLANLWDARYVVNNPDNMIVAGVPPTSGQV